MIKAKFVAAPILLTTCALYAESLTVVSDGNMKWQYVGLGSASFPAIPSVGLPAGWEQVNYDDSAWRSTKLCRHPAWMDPAVTPGLSGTGANWISSTANCTYDTLTVPDYWVSNGQRGTYLFRKKFVAPGAAVNVQVAAAAAGDNYGFVYLNGSSVLEPKNATQGGNNFEPHVGPAIGAAPAGVLACENVIAVENQNGGAAPVFVNGPHGVVFSLKIDYETAKVDWQPPVANELFQVAANGAAPIRFKLTTQDGRDIPDALGVYLSVYGPSKDSSWGNQIVRFDLGNGSLRHNNGYMALLSGREHGLQDGKTYTAVVRDVCTNDVVGSLQLKTRAK